jgi:bifunctional non-homologous end joining protein LigD
MTTQPLPRTELYYQEGSSDKIYRAAVERSGDGFVVNFAYGRRGATLTAGTKTQAPVPYDEALIVYTRLVKSKTAKGYKPVDGDDTGDCSGGTGMVTAVMVREDTGLRAQLLNPLDSLEDASPYLQDDWWCLQEKHDGRRMLVRKAGTSITAANRRGQSTGCPAAIHAALLALPGDFVIDGECVGETYFTFDLLEGESGDLRRMTYMERGRQLCALLQDCENAVVAVETAFGTQEKQRMLARLRDNGREGIVLKDLRACWSVAQPAGGGPALKFKFWQTCSCIVVGVNARRSVSLELGGRPIGNVTIPPSHAVPEPGQVVEIRYLYVTGQGGALYQPVYLGVRDDVEPAECTPEIQRLKYKAAA